MTSEWGHVLPFRNIHPMVSDGMTQGGHVGAAAVARCSVVTPHPESLWAQNCFQRIAFPDAPVTKHTSKHRNMMNIFSLA